MVVVFYLGKIMERAETNELFENPRHPYTKLLMEAIPEPVYINKGRKRTLIKGEAPNPTNPPAGCRFVSRCPISESICQEDEPRLEDKAKDHFVACHFS
jgi:oligopeptide/dipeptide ABC transporter ATP-binding protein